MLTKIFVNRANVDYNKEQKLLLRPPWVLQQGDKLINCFEFTVKGRITSKSSFVTPLEIEGGVCLWLETDQEVIYR